MSMRVPSVTGSEASGATVTSPATITVGSAALEW